VVSDHVDQLVNSLYCPNLLQDKVVEQNETAVNQVLHYFDSFPIFDVDLLPIEKHVEGEVLGLSTNVGHHFLTDSLNIRDSQESYRLIDIWQILILYYILKTLHKLHILHPHHHIIHRRQVQHHNQSCQLRHSGYLVIALLKVYPQQTLHTSVCDEDVTEIWRI
jgi:hypothetical protein